MYVNAMHADSEGTIEKSLDWLISSARVTDNGVAWADSRSAEELLPTLYSGGAGIVMTLLEAYRHFNDDRFGDIALRASREIGANIETWDDSYISG